MYGIFKKIIDIILGFPHKLFARAREIYVIECIVDSSIQILEFVLEWSEMFRISVPIIFLNRVPYSNAAFKSGKLHCVFQLIRLFNQ